MTEQTIELGLGEEAIRQHIRKKFQDEIKQLEHENAELKRAVQHLLAGKQAAKSRVHQQNIALQADVSHHRLMADCHAREARQLVNVVKKYRCNCRKKCETYLDESSRVREPESTICGWWAKEAVKRFG